MLSGALLSETLLSEAMLSEPLLSEALLWDPLLSKALLSEAFLAGDPNPRAKRFYIRTGSQVIPAPGSQQHWLTKKKTSSIGDCTATESWRCISQYLKCNFLSNRNLSDFVGCRIF